VIAFRYCFRRRAFGADREFGIKSLKGEKKINIRHLSWRAANRGGSEPYGSSKRRSGVSVSWRDLANLGRNCYLVPLLSFRRLR
jgi:hypothetical protein